MLNTRAVALFGLVALAAAGPNAATPALAQGLTYTLSGVTFDDGAIASGFFVFNPTTNTYTVINITTTGDAANGFSGYRYTSSDVTFPYSIHYPSYYLFEFQHGGDGTSEDVGLNVQGQASAPGVYQLNPGVANADGSGYSESGETESSGTGTGFQFHSRGISSGSVIVTPAPEPSQAAALGVGLLGLAGLIFKARRRGPVS